MKTLRNYLIIVLMFLMCFCSCNPGLESQNKMLVNKLEETNMTIRNADLKMIEANLTITKLKDSIKKLNDSLYNQSIEKTMLLAKMTSKNYELIDCYQQRLKSEKAYVSLLNKISK